MKITAKNHVSIEASIWSFYKSRQKRIRKRANLLLCVANGKPNTHSELRLKISIWISFPLSGFFCAHMQPLNYLQYCHQSSSFQTPMSILFFFLYQDPYVNTMQAFLSLVTHRAKIKAIYLDEMI
jgi:hypothetical protein